MTSMKPPVTTATISWLTSTDSAPLVLEEGHDGYIRTPIPMSPEVGSGWVEMFPLGEFGIRNSGDRNSRNSGDSIFNCEGHRGRYRLVNFMHVGQNLRRMRFWLRTDRAAGFRCRSHKHMSGF